MFCLRFCLCSSNDPTTLPLYFCQPFCPRLCLRLCVLSMYFLCYFYIPIGIVDQLGLQGKWKILGNWFLHMEGANFKKQSQLFKDDGRARVGVGRGVVNHKLLAPGGRYTLVNFKIYKFLTLSPFYGITTSLEGTLHISRQPIWVFLQILIATLAAVFSISSPSILHPPFN